MTHKRRKWNILSNYDPTLFHPIFGTQERAYEVGLKHLGELLGEVILLSTKVETSLLTTDSIEQPEDKK